MTKQTVCSVLAALGVLLVTSTALADRAGPADITKDGDQLIYDFTDADTLVGGSYGAHDDLIEVLGKPSRRTLIRPRATFVPELLQSVEQI